MLELVRSHIEARMPRFVPAWDDLDEAHAAVWEAVRHLFPKHAMVDQADYGTLLVSWTIDGRRRGAHFATPVLIRIEAGLLVALWTCDEESRRDIAAQQVETVREALEDHDPHSRVARCGVIVLGE